MVHHDHYWKDRCGGRYYIMGSKVFDAMGLRSICDISTYLEIASRIKPNVVLNKGLRIMML